MWKVEQILEADFGCEERQPGEKKKVLVILKDEEGRERELLQEDDLLYERKIDEGDPVYPDADGTLRKCLGNDWTEKCGKGRTDLAAFADRLAAMQEGKDLKWYCPFCGGKVEVLSRDEKHTKIGCLRCDMRIDLETGDAS